MNYETWNALLWINADEVLRTHWLTRASEIQICPTYQNEYMSLERRIVTELSKELDVYCDTIAEEMLGPKASFFSDILNNALGQINWHEVAEELLISIKE